MIKKYLITLETNNFRNILSLKDENIILMDEKKFHEIFLEHVKDKIDSLIHDDFVESLAIDEIFPEAWDVLKDMVTVKFMIENQNS